MGVYMLTALDAWVSLGLLSAVVCGGWVVAGMLRSGMEDRLRPVAPARDAAAAVSGMEPGAPPPGLSFAAEWFDPADELAGALGQAAPMARRHAVDLMAAIQPGLRLRMDRTTFRAVLGAVLDQALAAAPGGKLLLTARREGAVVEVAVLDDGAGTDGPSRRAALRAFEQMAGLQGGSLSVTAIPTEGTTVALRMPVPSPLVATPAAAPGTTGSDVMNSPAELSPQPHS
jgi:hypothetical protein